MKKVKASHGFFFVCILTGIVLLTNCSTKPAETQAQDGAAQKDSTQLAYACPMHPDVKGKEGDTCPSCHMKLELISSATDTTKVQSN